MARSPERISDPRRKKILIAVLALGAALIYLPMLLRKGDGKDPVALAGEVQEEPLGRNGPASPDEPRAPERKEPKENSSPPARAGNSVFDGLFGSSPEKPADGEPKVTSIVQIGNDRMAVIDGKVVRPGDRVGGRRIAEIREGEVLLRAKDGITAIPLASSGRAGGERKGSTGEPAKGES